MALIRRFVSTILQLAASPLALLGSTAAVASGRCDLKCVLTAATQKWASNTTISFPGSTEFADATARWTIFAPPTYSASIRPGTEEDIIKAIQLVTSLNIPFLARGAGHSYTTTLADLKDGLSIDLSQHKAFSLDNKAKTMTIGPGVTAGDILDPLYNAGLEIQTGSASCPSFIGVTIGGGVGRWQGLHGLLIDALLSVRIITASGQILVASHTENPDLFWAVRGAGANFGVITSATYQLHPLTNEGNLFHAEFAFPSNLTDKYFDAIEAYDGKVPTELASITIMGYNSDTSLPIVRAGWTYYGPEDEGRNALAPLYAITQPYFETVVAWNKLLAVAAGGIDQVLCQDNIVRDLYSLNLKSYSASTYKSTFASMSKFWADYPGGRNSILNIEIFPNQAMVAIPDEETAYPYRSSTGYVNPTLIWAEGDTTTATAANKLGNEVRKAFAATSGYGGDRVFINYARGDEGLEKIYGSNKLPRLAELKKKYDPQGLFSVNNGLPTHYPSSMCSWEARGYAPGTALPMELIVPDALQSISWA